MIMDSDHFFWLSDFYSHTGKRWVPDFVPQSSLLYSVRNFPRSILIIYQYDIANWEMSQNEPCLQKKKKKNVHT